MQLIRINYYINRLEVSPTDFVKRIIMPRVDNDICIEEFNELQYYIYCRAVDSYVRDVSKLYDKKIGEYYLYDDDNLHLVLQLSYFNNVCRANVVI